MGAATYILKHDIIWPNGTLWKAAGSVVGLYDRLNGKLVTDLDNWVAPDPTPPTGLVYGTDPAPLGWIWETSADGSHVLAVDPDMWNPITYPSTGSKWDLTAEEAARRKKQKDYAAEQKKRGYSWTPKPPTSTITNPSRPSAADIRNMIGAPNTAQATPSPTPRFSTKKGRAGRIQSI